MSELSSDTPPLCPKCGSLRASRVKRTGVLQKFVLHYFGLYPWECSGCRTLFLFRNRGQVKRKRRTTGEVHIPPVKFD
jgi:hypothetical protein